MLGIAMNAPGETGRLPVPPEPPSGTAGATRHSESPLAPCQVMRQARNGGIDARHSS